MRTPLRRLILMGTIGLVALAALSFPRPRTAAAKPAPGAAPGDPPLIDLQGYKDLVAKYQGKALMVNFWAMVRALPQRISSDCLTRQGIRPAGAGRGRRHAG